MDVLKTIIKNVTTDYTKRVYGVSNKDNVSNDKNALINYLNVYVNKNNQDVIDVINVINIDKIYNGVLIILSLIYILVCYYCIKFYKNIHNLTVIEYMFLIVFSTIIMSYYKKYMDKKYIYLKNIKNSLK
jgi:hypothetical protein